MRNVRELSDLCEYGTNSAADAFATSTRSLATAVEASTPEFSQPLPEAPALEKRTKKTPRPPFNTAIILNRAPLLTRIPTVFERAYYKYQQRIQRALHNPFPYEFYFKQGSLLEARFNLEEAKRDRVAFGKGFGADWEGAFPKSAAGLPELGQEEVEEPAPRKNAADETTDFKSLDRHGTRNLYLLLKKKEDGRERWVLPRSTVDNDELLHEVGSLLVS